MLNYRKPMAKEPKPIIDVPGFVVKDTVAFYEGRVICLCDVYLDLSKGLSRREVATKYRFPKKCLQIVFRESARFYSLLTFPKYKKQAALNK